MLRLSLVRALRAALSRPALCALHKPVHRGDAERTEIPKTFTAESPKFAELFTTENTENTEQVGRVHKTRQFPGEFFAREPFAREPILRLPRPPALHCLT